MDIERELKEKLLKLSPPCGRVNQNKGGLSDDDMLYVRCGV